MPRATTLALPLLLAACAETVSTTPTTFTYRGEILRAEVRTYDQNGRTYQRRVIYDNPRRVSCSATDDLDCVSALRESRRRRDD